MLRNSVKKTPKKSSILIAEDNEDLRNLFKIYFEDEDFAVTVAGDGFEAFKNLAGKKPDAVLADIAMPELDGVQLLKISKVLWPHIPFFIMTADMGWSRSGKLPRLGASDVFEKGTDPTGIVAKIVSTVLLSKSC